MKLRRFRLLTALAAVALLALPAAALSGTTDLVSDRGIVQSIDANQIELRALDGTVTPFSLSATTRVKLNGLPAKLTDIRPGYVAVVVHDGTRPAIAIRAFGRPAVLTARGVVTALTRTSITLTTDVGPVTVPLEPGTAFRLRGGPGFRWQARPGALVVVKYPDGGAAKTVNVLKRARA